MLVLCASDTGTECTGVAAEQTLEISDRDKSVQLPA